MRNTKGKDNRSPVLSAEEKELGLGANVSRRDFIGNLSLGSGAVLLGAMTPASLMSAGGSGNDAWTGPGGVGDYAQCNGNTWPVVDAGHGIRDHEFEKKIAGAEWTGETYDLVVCGGGFAGLLAARTFLKETGRQRQCLVLDNHPMFGGEAKRNEFIVRGQRLMGPQGSNETDVPTNGWRAEMWKDLGMPTELEFAKPPKGRKEMQFDRGNYRFIVWEDDFENHGFFFDELEPHWVTNPWGNNLKGTPWSPDVRKDMLRWRHEPAAQFEGDSDSFMRWLDTMTYDEYLTKHRGFHPEVARYADPLLASGVGLGSDVISSFTAMRANYPGFEGLKPEGFQRSYRVDHGPDIITTSVRGAYSFPGGNDGIMRALLKWLNPAVIEGSPSFNDVHNGRIRFEQFDRPNAVCRMRSGATIVRVDQDPDAEKGISKPSIVTYLKDGKTYTVHAKTVIWAGGSWTGKHVIQNLPKSYSGALQSYHRSPILVVNVALDNWRAMYKLGYTALSYRGGLGFSANLRAPMQVGDFRPPNDPDQPAVLTFYIPFCERGLSIREQGVLGRTKMFGTSYRNYELQIRRQLTKMLGPSGFDAKRDIAGITLNRWGHAYVNSGPGFYFARDGGATASDILRNPLGSLSFGHSEMSGMQTYPAAGKEGIRAAHQVLERL